MDQKTAQILTAKLSRNVEEQEVQLVIEVAPWREAGCFGGAMISPWLSARLEASPASLAPGAPMWHGLLRTSKMKSQSVLVCVLSPGYHLEY